MINEFKIKVLLNYDFLIFFESFGLFDFQMDYGNRVLLSVLFLSVYCFNAAQTSIGFYVDNENAQSIPLSVSRSSTFSLLLF